VPGGADWTHANGLIHDPSDDSFIVTVRHQDCAIKIDRKSGALTWVLGTPDGWRIATRGSQRGWDWRLESQ